MPCSCGNEGGTRLVYSCAGAANTGFLADQVARALNREGVADMTCLAAVGAGLSGFLESARSSGRNIVIDGCPVGCGRRIFEARSLPLEQYLVTDFGVTKGKTEITSEVVERVTAALKDKLLVNRPAQG